MDIFVALPTLTKGPEWTTSRRPVDPFNDPRVKVSSTGSWLDAAS